MLKLTFFFNFRLDYKKAPQSLHFLEYPTILWDPLIKLGHEIVNQWPPPTEK